MDKKLSVRLNGKPVGILEQDISGKMSFVYLSEATQALSLALPIQEEPFNDTVCKAYFGGLLPESDNARKMIGNKYNVNPKNDFSLLKVIGNDCAGAVSFHQLNESIKEAEFVELKGNPLSEEELAKHIKDLPQRPLFLGVKDLRLSLAGVQDKAAVCVINNVICLPIDDSPTTHILKPAIEGLEETIENEYICLKIAKTLGIDVPSIEIKQANGINYLLIERYDREIKLDGTIKRIHQEDFCQALGSASAYKYQSEGGPGLKECFNLLKRFSRPAVDRNKLAERIVFNFFIGNMDAHGKNFSLLHYNDGLIKLSPMYDVLCTKAYDGLTDKMAMKIGGYYESSKILPRHWEKLSEEIGYSYPQLKKFLLDQAKKLPLVAEKEILLLQERDLPHILAGKILEIVKVNCNRVIKQFEI